MCQTRPRERERRLLRFVSISTRTKTRTEVVTDRRPGILVAVGYGVKGGEIYPLLLSWFEVPNTTSSLHYYTKYVSGPCAIRELVTVEVVEGTVYPFLPPFLLYPSSLVPTLCLTSHTEGWGRRLSSVGWRDLGLSEELGAPGHTLTPITLVQDGDLRGPDHGAGETRQGGRVRVPCRGPSRLRTHSRPRSRLEFGTPTRSNEINILGVKGLDILPVLLPWLEHSDK